MDELMLDGNAVAGMLSEVFAVEMTTATMTCGNCGTSGAVGAMHAFRGAGIVMRSPNCDNTVAKIVEDGTRIRLNFGVVRGGCDVSPLAGPRGRLLGPGRARVAAGGDQHPAQQSGGSDPSTLAGSVQLTSFARAQSSPPVRLVFARWSACMRGYGDHYGTPFTAAADPRWTRSATPSPLEIQTAEHDIGCKLRANVLGVEFAVVSHYQDQAITARAAAFAQTKKTIAREALGLRRLMARLSA
jgi:Family of unknown function (DUF6510)